MDDDSDFESEYVSESRLESGARTRERVLNVGDGSQLVILKGSDLL